MRLKYPIPRMPGVRTLAESALANADNRDWYRWAAVEVSVAAGKLRTEGHDVDPKRLADLLALFSPRVAISRSVVFALTYVRTGEYMYDCVRTVRASVRHYERTGEIRGPKTAPFARAIMGDPTALVLDTHMGYALGVDPKRFEVRAVWNAAAKRLRSTARFLGWELAETQAAIWAGAVRRGPYAVARKLEIVSELDFARPVMHTEGTNGNVQANADPAPF